ncbi:hypothetical protein BD289DRAFT_483296 [Coniella lustricola]|uniref:Uncharacterized protein n=1 Tax=Coniella lustricola TaxID=2025994 RepID=A0A2T3A5Y4_9PEZI|nr:hypothetical protein BD289DRAFT_483296 [Coniella lustricola]
MTRVTPLPRELAKLTRSLGSTVAAPSFNQLLSTASKSGAARVRKELDNGLAADVPASERTITTTHRPSTTPTPSPTRTIPLMQAFHSTQSPSARAAVPTIDCALLPSMTTILDADSDAFAQVRVPLLPDNFAPVRSPANFAPEAVDAPLPKSEIVVMAADPTSVNAVSALTEVEGMTADGVELRFNVQDARYGSGSGNESDGEYAGGMLTDLWKGLVDDVLGSSSNNKGRPAF